MVMTLENWLTLMAVVGMVLLCWFWFDSLAAREVAVRMARRICEQSGCQLLDSTVAIAKIRPAPRRGAGGTTLRRVYHFEYSDNGDNRCHGSVVMLGREVEVCALAVSVV